MKLQSIDSGLVDNFIVAVWPSGQPGELSAMEPSTILSLPRPISRTLPDSKSSCLETLSKQKVCF